MRTLHIYPVEKMREWIAEGKTQQWIGEQLGIPTKLIQKACKKHGIKCQRTGPRSGEGHKNWKGPERTGKSGYILEYSPNHPSCLTSNLIRAQKANGKYFRKKTHVQKHRLVMEQMLGRYLSSEEVVHHKNGNVQDNRPENLELFSTNAEHLAATLVGKTPNWTEQGKAAIQQAIDQVAAIRRQHREAGAPLNKQTKLRNLFLPCTKEQDLS
jgi:hypothetical protein